VLSRALERAGLTTVGITLVREHTDKVKPPRALWVPYPYGRPLGAPDDPDLQHRIIRAAVDLFAASTGPVLAEFADSTEDGDLTLPQASDAVRPTSDVGVDVAFEVTTLRPYYEQWLAGHGGRTGVGLSGVDQRRFRGGVRFLEAFARGEDADMNERPSDVSREQFLRWLVDDLKAFYFEARMAQQPRASYQELYRWLWSETALSGLLQSVRDRLKTSANPTLDQLAFGIAR
jgi:hypothetical protein